LARLIESLAYSYPALPLDATVTTYQRDPTLFEPREMMGVIQVVDHLVAASEHRRDIKLAAECLGCAGDSRRLGEHLRRAQQRLRWHTGIEGALTSHEMGLDKGDLATVLGQTPSQHLAGGTGTDHDHIEHPGLLDESGLWATLIRHFMHSTLHARAVGVTNRQTESQVTLDAVRKRPVRISAAASRASILSNGLSEEAR
jgi:hypothetical protein